MKKFLSKYPLWLTLFIYWLVTFALIGASFTKTNGHFGYPLDDSYIHMAIGKHFVNDSFWGVSQNGFSSTTSSPLWTLLIAIFYKLLGVNDWIPLALCFLFGSLTIFLCYSLLSQKLNSFPLTLSLLLIVFLAPLPILTLIGMEHVLHSLLTIGLIYTAVSFLTKSEKNKKEFILLALLSSAVTITRYEGLFLVFGITALFLYKRQVTKAFLIGGAGLLPLIIYGTISVLHGWFFFPNSVLLKGNTPVLTIEGIYNFALHLPINLIKSPGTTMLIVAILGSFFWRKKQNLICKRETYLVFLFILTTLLHMQLASTGWFYRYETYLIITGCVIFTDMISPLIKDHPVKINKILNYATVLVFAISIVIPLTNKSIKAFQEYPFAVKNIYDQQYQMGLFLQEYYTGKTIAANDIGAINYLTNIKTLDLYGLGSMEPAIAKRDGSFDKNKIDELVFNNHVEIVIIYNSWFEGKIPDDWIQIGEWQIANNVICGDRIVSFYAPNAMQKNKVIANLKDFSSQLPSDVVQSGMYTGH